MGRGNFKERVSPGQAIGILEHIDKLINIQKWGVKTQRVHPESSPWGQLK